MTKLIVNADDFGLHSLVNEAIAKGHRQGIITSTSLLANGEAFAEAVEMADELPQLGIGIHIALVGGLSPVCNPASVSSLLTENGLFPETHTEVIKHALQGELNYQEVYQEIDAQFAKIMETGLHITHVDGHQHLHVLPPVLDIVISLMKKYGLNKMRIPTESPFFFNGNYNPVRIIGRSGLTLLAKHAKKRVKPFYFRSPDSFWGMINGGNLSEKAVLQILQKIKHTYGVHEIMTHPGMDNRTLGDKYTWGYQWEEELAAMCSPRVRAYLEKEQIELINFGDLP